MKMYDFDPHHLPHELVAAIGLALTCAAQTEDIVDEAIAGLAGVAFDVGGAITTHISMSLKFGILSSLAELRFSDPDILAEFDTRLLAVQLAMSKRNGLAHNGWAIDPDDGSVGQVCETSHTHYEMKLVPMTVNEIKVVGEEIYRAGIFLQTFLGLHNISARIPDVARPRAHENHAKRKAYRKRAFP